MQYLDSKYLLVIIESISEGDKEAFYKVRQKEFEIDNEIGHEPKPFANGLLKMIKWLNNELFISSGPIIIYNPATHEELVLDTNVMSLLGLAIKAYFNDVNNICYVTRSNPALRPEKQDSGEYEILTLSPTIEMHFTGSSMGSSLSSNDDTAQLFESERTVAGTKKISISQIALIHCYEGPQITRDNASKIASKHGYVSKNSGEGLYHKYSMYCNSANRRAMPKEETKLTLRNKIKLIESVSVLLTTDKAKNVANSDLERLTELLKIEFQQK